MIRDGVKLPAFKGALMGRLPVPLLSEAFLQFCSTDEHKPPSLNPAQNLTKNNKLRMVSTRSAGGNSNKVVAAKKSPASKKASGGVVKASKAAKGAGASVSTKETKPASKRKAAKGKKEDEEEEAEEDEEEEGDEDAEAPPAKKTKTALEALKVGDTIPEDFPSLFTQAHEPFSLYEAAQESGLVLFFYPKANTPGCTNQACNYRDNHEKFVEKGFKVYGVSADSEKSLSTWKTKQNYQYDFVSDKDRHIVKLFGVSKGTGVVRSHVVVAKGGKLVHIKAPTPAKESWEDALKAIGEL
ncbi:thioredoxin-like protein [Chytriomyces sp. MP71]|nr:thioredoxin-like protein [Chytriomyces sp. MP71]